MSASHGPGAGQAVHGAARASVACCGGPWFRGWSLDCSSHAQGLAGKETLGPTVAPLTGNTGPGPRDVVPRSPLGGADPL